MPGLDGITVLQTLRKNGITTPALFLTARTEVSQRVDGLDAGADNYLPNKTFSQWNEVFADVTIASAILDRVLHHCTVINIKGESYRLKERKEFMRQKQQIVNTLFQQGNA